MRLTICVFLAVSSSAICFSIQEIHHTPSRDSGATAYDALMLLQAGAQKMWGWQSKPTSEWECANPGAGKHGQLDDPCGAVLDWVKSHATHNKPDSVLKEFDSFAWKQNWLMAIGDDKGTLLDDSLLEVIDRASKAHNKGPVHVLEIGTFLGYSAVRMGRLLQRHSIGKLITVEINPYHADVARQLIAFAGLQDTIEVRHGKSDDVIPTLKGHTFDFVFLDHPSSLYGRDARALEANGCFVPGRTVLFADNVGGPFESMAADYLSWVRKGDLFESTYHEETNEYSEAGDNRNNNPFQTSDEAAKDGVEVSHYLGTSPSK